ncbi:response regulator transcription factor [Chloroflexi bacterium TSY]|nr:response regulator transcription factor [Chloroflexi bacterium TSY]
MSSQIRILVADDHPIVRDGLIAVLNTQPDFDVIGEAQNGRELLELFVRLQPDVILLDIEMPEIDGVEVLHQLRDDQQPFRAIVFTAFDTDDRIVAAVQAGAQGYLLKGAPREELFNAVRIVHAGGSLLQPVVASKLIQQMSQVEPDSPTPESLTERELDVLALLARGLQNKEIAAELTITERTVKFHVSSNMGKLGAGNRTEAVSLAAQRGLVTL